MEPSNTITFLPPSYVVSPTIFYNSAMVDQADPGNFIDPNLRNVLHDCGSLDAEFKLKDYSLVPYTKFILYTQRMNNQDFQSIAYYLSNHHHFLDARVSVTEDDMMMLYDEMDPPYTNEVTIQAQLLSHIWIN